MLLTKVSICATFHTLLKLAQQNPTGGISKAAGFQLHLQLGIDML